MKIINLNSSQSSRVDKAANTEKSAEVQNDVGKRDAGASRDSVDLSASSHISELTGIAMEAPVDEVEFEELKAAIRSGEYKPDLQGLADRMLGDGAALDLLTEG